MLPEIVEKIRSILIPRFPQGVDSLQWRAAPNGVYSTTSAYAFLEDDGIETDRAWKRLWGCYAPEKVRFFLWLIRKEALPTNLKRFHSHLAQTAAALVVVQKWKI